MKRLLIFLIPLICMAQKPVVNTNVWHLLSKTITLDADDWDTLYVSYPMPSMHDHDNSVSMDTVLFTEPNEPHNKWAFEKQILISIIPDSVHRNESDSLTTTIHP